MAAAVAKGALLQAAAAQLGAEVSELAPVMHDLLESGVLVVSHQVEYLAPVTADEQPLTINLWVDSVGGSRFASATTCWTGTCSPAGRVRRWPRSTSLATPCAG